MSAKKLLGLAVAMFGIIWYSQVRQKMCGAVALDCTRQVESASRSGLPRAVTTPPPSPPPTPRPPPPPLTQIKMEESSKPPPQASKG